MLSGNSLRQTVHTHCASVHQAAKLVAALLRVEGVTAGLVESNGSLPLGLWLTASAGWLPRTGISSRTLCSVIEYGLPLPFYFPGLPGLVNYEWVLYRTDALHHATVNAHLILLLLWTNISIVPLTVSCFSKIQIGFTFLVPAQPGSPGKRAVKLVCVYVCVCHDRHLKWHRTVYITGIPQLFIYYEKHNMLHKYTHKTPAN